MKHKKILSLAVNIVIVVALVLLTILMPTDMSNLTNVIALLSTLAVIIVGFYLIGFTSLGDY